MLSLKSTEESLDGSWIWKGHAAVQSFSSAQRSVSEMMQASVQAYHCRCKEVDMALEDVIIREGAALEAVGQ